MGNSHDKPSKTSSSDVLAPSITLDGEAVGIEELNEFWTMSGGDSNQITLPKLVAFAKTLGTQLHVVDAEGELEKWLDENGRSSKTFNKLQFYSLFLLFNRKTCFPVALSTELKDLAINFFEDPSAVVKEEPTKVPVSPVWLPSTQFGSRGSKKLGEWISAILTRQREGSNHSYTISTIAILKEAHEQSAWRLHPVQKTYTRVVSPQRHTCFFGIEHTPGENLFCAVFCYASNQGTHFIMLQRSGYKVWVSTKEGLLHTTASVQSRSAPDSPSKQRPFIPALDLNDSLLSVSSLSQVAESCDSANMSSMTEEALSLPIHSPPSSHSEIDPRPLVSPRSPNRPIPDIATSSRESDRASSCKKSLESSIKSPRPLLVQTPPDSPASSHRAPFKFRGSNANSAASSEADDVPTLLSNRASSSKKARVKATLSPDSLKERSASSDDGRTTPKGIKVSDEDGRPLTKSHEELKRSDSRRVDDPKIFKKALKKVEASNLRCLKLISKKFPDVFFHQVTTSPDLDQAFQSIDTIRTQHSHILQLAILYSDPTTTDIERLVKKKPPSPDYAAFLKALAIPPLQDGKATTQYQDIKVEWMVGTEMKKQAIRSFIGNSQCLIIFHDSETPFDPSNLFLGQVTNFVCVASPWKGKSTQGPAQQWTLAFFVHFETKLHKVTETELAQQTAQQESLIQTRLCDFEPKIPSGHIFEVEELLDFIVTKCFNSKMNFMKYHPIVKRMFELPVGNALRDIVKNFDPDWFYSQVGRKSIPGIN